MRSQDISVRVGDLDLRLRFSMKALLALGDLWNTESDKEIERRLNRGRASDLIDFIWAACRTYHPEVTREMLVDIFDVEGGEPLVRAVSALLEAQSAPSDEKKTAAGDATEGN